ncbi:MAG: 4-hydroxy-3-methylbut-2-enyl diphosphate reductase [Candidatus Pacebacteria bacterium]|nr:4-hydroxy-3-methylbut-2-enyl diphosphate reductase [Candidatus Paceibacterota bacterium]
MVHLYQDPDVTYARKHGAVVRLNSWTLHLPPTFGFCGGVLNAIRLLQKVTEEKPDNRIWLLGDIIHNETVNTYFRELGVHILPEHRIGEIFACVDRSDIVVIPAFGIPKNLDTKLRETFPAGHIVDTTCRYVKRIWDFVREMVDEGRTVVIHGKPQHPETQATLSRSLTANNAVILVPDIPTAGKVAEAVRTGTAGGLPEALIRNPAHLRLDRLALVNQTTMLFSETKRIEAIIDAAAQETGADFRSSETVCEATQDRQDAALKLCRTSCDLLLVIGGYSSSNTNQLYRLASQHAPTFFINNADAIERDRIRHYLPEKKHEVTTQQWLAPDIRDIGVLAGASCPASDIGDVIRKFRRFCAGVGDAGESSQTS